jgi:hypothetical protein
VQDDGSNYEDTVSSSPTKPTQTCDETKGKGKLDGSDVAVTVKCSTVTHKISGNIKGLTNGKAVVLRNNGGDDYTIDADGSFTFSAPVENGKSYDVTVFTDPANGYCKVTNGSGPVGDTDITDVQVTCKTYATDACKGWAGDDFEDGNADVWYLGATATSSTVIAGAAANGTKYGLEVVGGNGNHYDGRRYTFAPVTPSYMSIWLQPDASNNARNYVVVGDSNTYNNGIFFLLAENNASWLFFNGGSKELPLVPSQWVHFELFLDWTAKTLDVKQDGVIVMTDYAFRSTTSTNVSQINLYNYDAATAHYDEIFFGGCP